MSIAECVICGYHYHEQAGLPEAGIAPGTHWAQVPEAWTCPECGAGKHDFEIQAQAGAA